MTDSVARLAVALEGRYRIERELGQGGMATVYLAEDLKHHRRVALKVLRPVVGEALGAERFLREIDIAAGLQHPNILPLFDSGAADGLLYYVMPYVEGESLRDRLDRERQLPVEDALQITREVADALSYAHSHGVVHRDIKPANILLAAGHALVADFGVACAITAAGEELTERGIAVGTPGYMSPEQGSGRDPLDGRSDLYALGCVLYEMLAGEPPFTGSTAQAVIARHMQERPPSLRVVRPTVAVGVQEVIERALAKAPADRYPTASQFVAALDAARSGRTARRRRFAQGAAILALAAAGVALWRLVLAPAQPLERDRIVVFPLVDPGEEGVGEEVALMIGTALEQTEPLKWIDGWTWLDESLRADVARLTPRAARRIARGRGARYYLDGSIARVGGVATVILRLTDVAGDSVVMRASARGAADPAAVAQLGLQAVNRVLPPLLAPGRRVDLAVVAGRPPRATASFLQGERAYRRGRFEDALVHYRDAVQADSTFAVAAFKGAQAASWALRHSEAGELVRVARTHDAGLAPRYRRFLRGFDDYLGLAADSAVRHFQQALELDPGWEEAWTGLAEVYTHLLPRDSPLDSLAASAFAEAHRLDPTFAPVLYHRIEIALRDGEPRVAARLMGTFREGQPDSALLEASALMLECVARGPDAVDWRGATRRSPRVVTEVARALTVGGLRQPRCARAAWTAVLAEDTTAPPHQVSFRWGALLGLQSVLLAQGRYRELERLLDADTLFASLHDRFYILDAIAGADSAIEARAAAGAERLRGAYHTAPADLSNRALWSLGIWEAHGGRAPKAFAIADTLAARAARSGDREDELLALSVAARASLARGDTAGALRRLEALAPNGTRQALTWELWESLGGERVLLAELRMARGEFAEAIRVASNFDAPAPVPYALYVPTSLALRWRAARALGDQVLARRVRQRLLELGRDDLVSAAP